jgi:hypothetical protein
MMSPLRRKLGDKRARVAHLIAHKMRLCGHTGKSLSRELGYTPTTVYRTIHGELHSPRVLDALRKLGVPEKYLFDPRNVRKV